MSRIKDLIIFALIMGTTALAMVAPIVYMSEKDKYLMKHIEKDKTVSPIYNKCKEKGIDLDVESLMYLHFDDDAKPIYQIVSDNCNLPDTIEYTVIDKSDKSLENIRKRISKDTNLAYDLKYDLKIVPYTKKGKINDWDGYLYDDRYSSEKYNIVRVDVTWTKF